MPQFPPGVHRKGGEVSAPVSRELAREFYAPILPIVADLHRQGLSLRAIARELDRRQIRPRNSWAWSATQVKRVLGRVREVEERTGQRLTTGSAAQTVPDLLRAGEREQAAHLALPD
jgi:hypothetical protein